MDIEKMEWKVLKEYSNILEELRRPRTREETGKLAKKPTAVVAGACDKAMPKKKHCYGKKMHWRKDKIAALRKVINTLRRQKAKKSRLQRRKKSNKCLQVSLLV